MWTFLRREALSMQSADGAHFRTVADANIPCSLEVDDGAIHLESRVCTETIGIKVGEGGEEYLNLAGRGRADPCDRAVHG